MESINLCTASSTPQMHYATLYVLYPELRFDMCLRCDNVFPVSLNSKIARASVRVLDTHSDDLYRQYCITMTLRGFLKKMSMSIECQTLILIYTHTCILHTSGLVWTTSATSGPSPPLGYSSSKKKKKKYKLPKYNNVVCIYNTEVSSHLSRQPRGTQVPASNQVFRVIHIYILQPLQRLFNARPRRVQVNCRNK